MSLHKQNLAAKLVKLNTSKIAITNKIVAYFLFAFCVVESSYKHDDDLQNKLHDKKDMMEGINLINSDDASTVCPDDLDMQSDIDTEEAETLEVDVLKEDGEIKFTVGDKWHNLILRLCTHRTDEHRSRLNKIFSKAASNQNDVFKIVSKANLCLAYAIYDHCKGKASDELVEHTDQVLQVPDSYIIEADVYQRGRFREVMLQYISDGIEILSAHDFGLLYLGDINLDNPDSIQDYTLQHYAYKVESALDCFGIDNQAPVFPDWTEVLERRFAELPHEPIRDPFDIARKFIEQGEPRKDVIMRIKKILTATHPPLVLSEYKPMSNTDRSRKKGSPAQRRASSDPKVANDNAYMPSAPKGYRYRQNCPLHAANALLSPITFMQ